MRLCVLLLCCVVSRLHHREMGENVRAQNNVSRSLSIFHGPAFASFAAEFLASKRAEGHNNVSFSSVRPPLCECAPPVLTLLRRCSLR